MNNEHHLPPACGQSPSPKFEHFLFSCKHALIFRTLKVTDVCWIAYRLCLVLFKATQNALQITMLVYMVVIFFFFYANDFHLWNKQNFY